MKMLRAFWIWISWYSRPENQRSHCSKAQAYYPDITFIKRLEHLELQQTRLKPQIGLHGIIQQKNLGVFFLLWVFLLCLIMNSDMGSQPEFEGFQTACHNHLLSYIRATAVEIMQDSLSSSTNRALEINKGSSNESLQYAGIRRSKPQRDLWNITNSIKPSLTSPSSEFPGHLTPLL